MFAARRSLASLLSVCLIIVLSLFFSMLSPTFAQQSDPVLQGCPAYTQPGNVSDVVLIYNRVEYAMPDNTLDTIAAWRGQNLWAGYASDNPLGLSSAGDRTAILSFTLAQNVVNGQTFTNDRVDIWFWDEYQPSELKMLPFLSVDHQFTDAAGNNMGSHLCGDYAIARTDFEALLLLAATNG